MPRVATVKTVYNDVFELRNKDFVEVGNNGGDANRATRVELRRVVRAVNKYLTKNPSPVVNIFGTIEEITRINTGWGESRIVCDTYGVTTNDLGGINLGCKHFDKANFRKLSKYALASATATATATTKKSTKRAPRLKAA